MAVTDTIEINGEEREIADAYAREQIATNAQKLTKHDNKIYSYKVFTKSGMSYDAESDEIVSSSMYTDKVDIAQRVNWHEDALRGVSDTMIAVKKKTDTDIAGLNSNLVEQKMLGWTVPKECPVQNYVDSDGVFHQKVGRLDLGSLKFTVQSQHNRIITEVGVDSIKSTIPTNLPNAYTDYCRTESSSNAWNNKETIGRCLVIESYSPTDITIYSPPSDLSELKGHYLYYELATPITMTIDGNEAVTQIKNDLGGLSFSVSGTTLSITDGTNTWTLSQ